MLGEVVGAIVCLLCVLLSFRRRWEDTEPIAHSWPRPDTKDKNKLRFYYLFAAHFGRVKINASGTPYLTKSHYSFDVAKKLYRQFTAIDDQLFWLTTQDLTFGEIWDAIDRKFSPKK